MSKPPPPSTGVLSTLRHLFRFRQELAEDPKRAAFQQRNGARSKEAHQKTTIENKAVEEHRAEGAYTKSVVYGGLDGIITTFAIVAACEGGELGGKALLCLGLSNLIADGLSMGIGDWVSEKAEQDFIKAEREREEWEFANYPDGEVEEMVDLYVKQGVPRADAETILNTMRKHKDLFVDHMLALELGMIPPDDESSAARKGLVTFCSFVGFGAVPLLALVVGSTQLTLGPHEQFRLTCIVTGACIYLLGAGRGHITHQPWHHAGMTMLISGGFAAVAAYVIASLMAATLGTPPPSPPPPVCVQPDFS